MSPSMKAVADAALKKKNVVVIAAPGKGATSKIRSRLEHDDLKVAYMNLGSPAGIYLGSDCIMGKEIWMKHSREFMEADVVVLDNAGHLTTRTLETVAKLLTDKKIYGIWLPKLKSVVTVFHGDARESAARLSRHLGTVKVDLQ